MRPPRIRDDAEDREERHEQQCAPHEGGRIAARDGLKRHVADAVPVEQVLDDGQTGDGYAQSGPKPLELRSRVDDAGLGHIGD